MLTLVMTLLPIYASAYSTYTYSIDGELLNSPDAYVPDVRIDYKTLGLDKEFNTPSDIATVGRSIRSIITNTVILFNLFIIPP